MLGWGSLMDIGHIVLVDSLFLLGVICLGCWFWVWRKAEARLLEQRFEALAVQQERLERLVEKVTAACHGGSLRLEPQANKQVEGVVSRTVLKRPVALSQQSRPYTQVQNVEQRYARARSLLGAGIDSGEVARNLALGIAEVEALRRVLKHESKAASR